MKLVVCFAEMAGCPEEAGDVQLSSKCVIFCWRSQLRSKCSVSVAARCDDSQAIWKAHGMVSFRLRPAFALLVPTKRSSLEVELHWENASHGWLPLIYVDHHPIPTCTIFYPTHKNFKITYNGPQRSSQISDC
jgi:hypothetical protein